MLDLILGHVRQQSDKAGSQHGNANSTVPLGTGTSSTAGENSTVSIDQRLECSQVFVVDVNRPWSFLRTIRTEAACQFLLQPRLLLTSLANFSTADSTHDTHLEYVVIWWEKSAGIYNNRPQIAPRKSSFRALVKFAHQWRGGIMEATRRSFKRSCPHSCRHFPQIVKPALCRAVASAESPPIFNDSLHICRNYKFSASAAGSIETNSSGSLLFSTPWCLGREVKSSPGCWIEAARRRQIPRSAEANGSPVAL